MRFCKGTSDKSGLVAVIFFLLGMGTLLPWNFFITAMNYFTDRLKNDTNSTQPDTYMFGNKSVLLAQLPLLLFTLLNSFLYQHMVFILLLFILTAILVKVKMDQDHFFSITMATIWFINMFGAVLQGSLFGLVGKMPPRFSSLFMSGQAVAGIFSGIAMLLSNIYETDSESSALGYFITPCVATLLTLCCYLILPHLRFAQLHLENVSTKTTLKEPSANSSEIGEVKLNRFDDIGETEACEKLNELKQEEKSTVPQVFKKIWVMALCVTCVFAVTLSVFPAITINTKPSGLFEGKGESAEIFKAHVFCLSKHFDSHLFSTYREHLYTIVFIHCLQCDGLGWQKPPFSSSVGESRRSIFVLFQNSQPSMKSHLFPLFVVLRVVFIPALMLCNVQPRFSLPVFFKHDMAYIIIMLVRPKDAETAGALMTFFLALGLSLGAALSFGLKMLL
ncbi:Equilibrative nucleoside transporter 2 [Labeo rohita]|uniref:Equilibrative nucleoside transporter 2 n=1 Tax=Labeo rohita TaxID=84645 RepID=A0ABQ8LKT1_LABRO|nr:Equilibrative nucleoside transporter 2 [Labeo rohita]